MLHSSPLSSQSDRDVSLPQRVVQTLAERRMSVSCAESCTGGLIAKQITDIPGSSAVFPGGAVTYTNEMKEKLLGVSVQSIAAHTEVSEVVAREMAQGARALFGSDFAVSTTGFAGPGGGTEQNPVGTVYVGVATPGKAFALRCCFSPSLSRAEIREAAAARALELLMQELGE